MLCCPELAALPINTWGLLVPVATFLQWSQSQCLLLCLLPAEGLEQHPGLWGAGAAPRALRGWSSTLGWFLPLLQGMELLPECLCGLCRRAEGALSLWLHRKGLWQPLSATAAVPVQQGVCSVCDQGCPMCEWFPSPWQWCVQHWRVCSRLTHLSGLQGFFKEDYSLFWASPQHLRNRSFFGFFFWLGSDTSSRILFLELQYGCVFQG